MLIFNEKDQYKNLLDNGFKKFINIRDLSILAREWYRQGYDKEHIKNKVIAFCKSKNKDFNEIKYQDKIIKALENLDRDIFPIKIIKFSLNELNNIKKIKDINAQKVLFVLYCLAKWRDKNWLYINCESKTEIKEIFLLANLNLNKKIKLDILNKLYKYNYINILLRPLLKCEINNFDNEINEPILEFEINNDMILYYDKWIGKKIITCMRCGKLTRVKSNRQKYCDNCSKIKEKKNI
jgi:hypothetical protein